MTPKALRSLGDQLVQNSQTGEFALQRALTTAAENVDEFTDEDRVWVERVLLTTPVSDEQKAEAIEQLNRWQSRIKESLS